MSNSTSSPAAASASAPAERPWWTVPAPDVCRATGSDPEAGLSAAAAAQTLATVGPNTIAAAPPPSAWAIALRQLADPMNLMLVGVVIVSIVIGQIPVAVLVAGLIILNIVLGTRQELKARASVDALANLQIPRVRVVRDGVLQEIDAPEVVPGDLVQLEAGDLVPADGRLLRAATLETQEAALTGESAPIAKDPGVIATADLALGDRANMVFQNTTVTRGTAAMIVTETGMHTQMGRIATMLTAVAPGKSPLQRELDGLTKVLGIIAWSAVAVMIILGLVRGETLATILLVGIAMAVSAIPSGLPTFVQMMLSHGAKQLADHRAVVKNLSDVETLGATSAINSDKTGTLTLNQMTATRLYAQGQWFSIDGVGYGKSGALRHAAGADVPDLTRLAYGLCLNSDATVSDTGVVVGDPTEAALVVLAAKLGVDATETRRAYPRVAEVPFDSAYKFMVTFHHVPFEGQETFLATMKGGPDVLLDRCTHAYTNEGIVPMADAREDILAANRRLSEDGLRVLGFAVRQLAGREDDAAADPMSLADSFTFVALVGIIDPLRPEAIEAVRIAHEAGIDVRMITGDHAVTAAAIGAQLGLADGAISGPELRTLSDEELLGRLPQLHVFGRVTPEDKLRIARLMQQGGDIVAMTGDAVNDAAALKQADIGVAMGSGSEVTKQAGKMILTDDNFGTLVTAIRLGRSIYDKIVSYVRYQMATLFSLVLLFLVSSIFDINDGIPLTPLMVLFLSLFITFAPVIVITLDQPADDLMHKPPRDTRVPLANRRAIVQWLLYGVVIFAVTLTALLAGPGQASTTQASVPVTMAFVVMCLGSLLGGLAMRRDPGSGLMPPLADAVKWLAIAAALTVACVEIGFLQRLLMTTGLSGGEWLAALGLSLIVPVVIETEKAIRRTRSRHVAA